MENKKQYIAPGLTVVSFRMEKGFFASGPTGFMQTNSLDLFLLEHDPAYNDQAQENWHEYNGGGDFFSWQD